MQRGVPRIMSGGSSSRRSARTKDNEEIVKEAALVIWFLRDGVGSSSRRKLNGIVSIHAIRVLAKEMLTMGSGSRRLGYRSSSTNRTLAPRLTFRVFFAWPRTLGLTELLDITALSAGILL
jgi:hypothetical protein